MRRGWPNLVLIDDDVRRRARTERAVMAVGVPFRSLDRLPSDENDLRDQVRMVILAATATPGALNTLRAAFPNARAIILSCDLSQAAAVAAFRAGADDFITLSSNEDEIAGVVMEYAASRESDAPDGLAGESAALSAARAFALRLAPTNVSVLVTGETGTGKDCIAAMLHRRSRRAKGPLVALNCAAIPEALLEGELFGYERGAFSGALTTYPGKLKLADGGTLLLDEIGELSLAGQAKILRAIETGEAWRLGAVAPTRFDARIVAATNRNLEAEVEAGRFREDLFYRLAVARIEIPPLRQRPEDIAPIARHLLTDLSARAGMPVPRLEECAVAVLECHCWKGNVRELRNVIEIALVTAQGGTVRAIDLPSYIKTPNSEARIEHGERGALMLALERTGGNKSEAAKALSCSRMTLYRKLARFGLAEALV